jgi:hypothetical protein
MIETAQPERIITVKEAARYFRRSPITIQLWCRDGTLIAFNYAVIRDVSGRWLIVIPESSS